MKIVQKADNMSSCAAIDALNCGWITSKLSDHFKLISGGTPNVKNNNFWNGSIVWVTPADIKDDEREFITGGKKYLSLNGAKQLEKRITKKGSVILSTTASIGKCKIAASDMYTNQNCHSLEPIGRITSSYLRHWIKLNASKLEDLSIGTTFPLLKTSDLKNMKICHPSVKQQEIICNILHNEAMVVENLKSLIENQTKAFDYYQKKILNGELMVAINDGGFVLFKRGDYKTVCLNSNNVKIPTSWTKVAAKDGFAFTVGRTPKKESNNYSGNLPWITISNFTGKNIKSYTALIASKSGGKIIPSGSLLGTFKMTIGKFAFVDKDCSTNEAIMAIRPGDTNDSLRYLYYALPSTFVEKAETNGIGVKLLNKAKIQEIEYLRPPLDEQTLIADFLDAQETLIERTKELLKSEEKKMAWLRRQLLSGKFEVTETNENA